MEVKLQSMKTFDGITEKKLGEETKEQIPTERSDDYDSSDDEADDENPGAKNRNVVYITKKKIYKMYKDHEKVTGITIKATILLLFLAYFAYAMYVRFGDDGSIRLLVLTAFVLFYITIKISRKFTEKIFKNISQVSDSSWWEKAMKITRWFLYVGMSIFIVTYIIVDVAIQYPGNLIPFAGIFLILTIFYLTSKYPEHVNWHIVFWGITIQFIFALIILRTSFGVSAFLFVGDRIEEFLEHANEGAIFFFGEDFKLHGMAFSVSAIIIFFSSVITIMDYLGAMHVFISVVGRFLAFCTGTSPAESICAAINIFLGLQAGPLMIRSFMKDLTKSELHAIMVGGFSTIAGGVMAVFILMGVPANHLLSASVMSAPAALAIAKLSYPENKKSKVTKNIYDLSPSSDRNIFDAASNGAMAALPLIGGIAVNVIAFISLLAFINATLAWFGDRIDIELSVEIIFSYLFYPIAYFIGIAVADCTAVGRLLGIKVFLNEVVAYQQLGVMIRNERALSNYTTMFNTSLTVTAGEDIFLPLANQTLVGGIIQERSGIITTYALCSFSNFGSIGTMLGILGGIVPSRRKDLSRMVLRAMIVGNVASFLTASIAGLLYKEL